MTADALSSTQENAAATPATLAPVAAVAASPAAPVTGTPAAGTRVETQEAEGRHKRLKGQIGDGQGREGQGREGQGREEQAGARQGIFGQGEDGKGRDGGERSRGPFGADGPSMEALMQELGFGEFISAPVSSVGGKEGQMGRGGGRGRGRGRGKDRGVVMVMGMVIGDRAAEGLEGAVETQGVFGSGEAWGGEGVAGWGDWEGFGGDDGDGGREEGVGRREDGRREDGEEGETGGEGDREESEEVEGGNDEMEEGERGVEADGEGWGVYREEGEEGEELEEKREEGEEGEEVEEKREEGEEGEEMEEGEEGEEKEREEGEEGEEREEDSKERKAREESGPFNTGTREKKERKLAGIGAAARMVGVDDQAVNRPSVGGSGAPSNDEGLMHGGVVLKSRPQVAAAGKLLLEKNASVNAGGKKSNVGKVKQQKAAIGAGLNARGAALDQKGRDSQGGSYKKVKKRADKKASVLNDLLSLPPPTSTLPPPHFFSSLHLPSSPLCHSPSFSYYSPFNLSSFRFTPSLLPSSPLSLSPFQCDAPGTDSIPVCTEPKLGPAGAGSAEPAMSQAEVHMAISTLRASAAWQLAFLPPLPQPPVASPATAAAGVEAATATASAAAGGYSAAAAGSAAASLSPPRGSDPSFDLLLEWFLSPYRVDVTMLKRLRPDVILTQMQEEPGVLSFEDVQNVLSHVLGSQVKIVHLDPPSLVEAINDVRRIGAALGQSQRAESTTKDLMQRIQTVRGMCAGRPRKKVVCIQWLDPIFLAGAWVPDLIRLAGGTGSESSRMVPEEELQDLVRAADAVIFAVCGCDLPASIAAVKREAVQKWKMFQGVSSTGGTEQFIQSSAAAAQSALPPSLSAAAGGGSVGARAAHSPSPSLPTMAVVEAARLFSRPGPSLVESLEVLAEILHPETQRFGHRHTCWAELAYPPAL
ncbi:unnamed protein product [Closterium sp. NIES-64]|nr:unnamed protein product [Closterium sp. NIES-64]